MKKKHRFTWTRLILSLSACAICLGAVIFLNYMTEVMSDTVKSKEITELISLRTDAMNGYFAGEIEFMHASEQLHDVEMGDLLKEDLMNLKAFERTDIEIVENYEITDVFFLKQNEDGVSARVTVDWTVSGIEGKDQFTATYEVSCQKHGESLKLVDFF